VLSRGDPTFDCEILAVDAEAAESPLFSQSFPLLFSCALQSAGMEELDGQFLAFLGPSFFYRKEDFGSSPPGGA